MKTTRDHGKTKPENLKNHVHGKITRKKIRNLTTIIVVIGILYSLIEPFWLENKHYTIESSQIPEAFDGKRIAFLSDIHYGDFYSRAWVAHVVSATNALHPDIVLLGGDYGKNRSEFLRPCFEELAKLRARFGVFGVLGNHDHWQGAQIAAKEMRRAGILSIDNKAFWVESEQQRIRIGGVGDHCEDIQILDSTVNGTKVEDFVILTSHNPDYTEEFVSDNIDLVLSGHSHGGQVSFFGLFAPKVPSSYGQKFRTGLVNVNKFNVIISNGIGTVFVPLRFFARPQIVIVELKKS